MKLGPSFVLKIAVTTALVLILGSAQARQAPPPPVYVFTDEPARLSVALPDGNVDYAIVTITFDGNGPRSNGTAIARGGAVSLSPLCEGIHAATFTAADGKQAAVRFLAIEPPPQVDADAARRTLPRNADKLLAGLPYTILSMGDSVMHTGDLESMLVMMLRRATGNERITFVDRSYTGRSVDAAVRFWRTDGPPNRPDLGLLMYGLNDQAAGCPWRGYIEQTRLVADLLAADCNADCIFMQPTPHIAIPVLPEDRTEDSAPPWFAFRTIGFAESLRPLGRSLGVPVANTFAAVWGAGGPTIEDSARNAWPMFPSSYNRQMESMIETGGRGDTIHPNALGHLAMARAVFDTIFDRQAAPPLTFSGSSRWTDAGVVSRVQARNTSAKRRTGTLQAYPLMGGAIDAQPARYDLPPGKAVEFEISWPQARQPEDLLAYPNNAYLAHDTCLVPVVDFSGGGSSVTCAHVPFEVQAYYLPGRQIASDTIRAQLVTPGGAEIQEHQIPGDHVGRIKLLTKAVTPDRTGWAVAEAAYVRFGGAVRGEATVDGDTAEWDNGNPQDGAAFPVGLPQQARWSRGPADYRERPEELMTWWNVRAGQKGVYFAIFGTGEPENDGFTLFFDTRDSALLGTPGRYYWCSGSFAADGRLRLGKGETSQRAEGMTGAWKKVDGGFRAELFVPYSLMELHAWPEFGGRDLGLSVWWVHLGPKGATHLMWSEDGHPWNTRWYGVVRLMDDPAQPLPYMVRIK